MKIDSYFIKEGKLLGLRMNAEANKPPVTAWYRIVAREFADYTYSFLNTAANTGTGWIDIQNVQSTYILDPIQVQYINHFFIGLAPSNGIFFLQYPANVDHNALTGYRPVDATAAGGIRGFSTPPGAPSIKTEMVSIKDLRPVFQIFNGDPTNAIVPKIHIYAMQYTVDGPYGINDPSIGGPDYVQKQVDDGNARIISIYGNRLASVPQTLLTQLQKRNIVN